MNDILFRKKKAIKFVSYRECRSRSLILELDLAEMTPMAPREKAHKDYSLAVS